MIRKYKPISFTVVHESQATKLRNECSKVATYGEEWSFKKRWRKQLKKKNVADVVIVFPDSASESVVSKIRNKVLALKLSK